MDLFSIIVSIIALIIIWVYRLDCKLEKEKERINKEQERIFNEMLDNIKSFMK